jgi:hypothetical protein
VFISLVLHPFSGKVWGYFTKIGKEIQQDRPLALSHTTYFQNLYLLSPFPKNFLLKKLKIVPN